jgi:cell wall-associated NlpC family hydrolase
LQVRTFGGILCSLTLIAVPAAPALAGGTGGVVAGGNAPTTAPAPKIHTAPITARTANIAYSGPVYEKTATGEVIPYTVPASETPSSTATTPSSTVPSTGGSPVVPVAPVAPVTAAVEEPKPELLVPGSLARYVDGLAAAPMSAPADVQEIIWAANHLIGLPYVYGGGHASFISAGYDCSGSVSFALHGASLLSAPEDSSEFMVWGSHGVGRWVTIFSNPEHAYMTIAGLRLDTSSADDPSNEQGPRWRPLRPANEGFTVRHPLGL